MYIYIYIHVFFLGGGLQICLNMMLGISFASIMLAPGFPRGPGQGSAHSGNAEPRPAKLRMAGENDVPTGIVTSKVRVSIWYIYRLHSRDLGASSRPSCIFQYVHGPFGYNAMHFLYIRCQV